MKFKVHGYDPIVDSKEVKETYKFDKLSKINKKEKYDLIILAVKHQVFKKMEKSIKLQLKHDGLIFDIKSLFKKKIHRKFVNLMNYLITGSAGFIGFHTCLKLLKQKSGRY